jgi:AraC-like DNA-binding protein
MRQDRLTLWAPAALLLVAVALQGRGNSGSKKTTIDTTDPTAAATAQQAAEWTTATAKAQAVAAVMTRAEIIQLIIGATRPSTDPHFAAGYVPSVTVSATGMVIPAQYLEIPRRALDAPNPSYNPVVAAIAARHLTAELAELRREGGLAPRVARLLQHAMGSSAVAVGCGAALQERICSELGMTHGSLRRELARAGTSLQALCAVVKLGEARRLLEESRLSMAEISERLGFLRQSAFTHFFQRNVGISPLRYRAQQSAD